VFVIGKDVIVSEQYRVRDDWSHNPFKPFNRSATFKPFRII
jgi:hypothetical protein